MGTNGGLNQSKFLGFCCRSAFQDTLDDYQFVANAIVKIVDGRNQFFCKVCNLNRVVLYGSAEQFHFPFQGECLCLHGRFDGDKSGLKGVVD